MHYLLTRFLNYPSGALIVSLVLGLLSGCNTTTVRTSQVEPIQTAPEPIPEHLLLDVGIDLFEPNIENIDTESGTTTAGVRYAESIIFAERLSKTMQESRNYGAVRVIPERQSETDVYVQGAINESDGETLSLTVTVTDSQGDKWFTRSYSAKASEFAYDKVVQQQRGEPFQTVFNQIANDIYQYMVQLKHNKLHELRTITKLKFAQRFSPQAFNEHMQVSNNGYYEITSLPAEGDPVMARIEQIRVRDQLFVDRLQDHYQNYSLAINEPYNQWRKESQFETRELRRLKSEATAKKIGGALAVLAGILAQGSGSSISRSAGVVGIGAGAYLFKDGLDKSAEAKIHAAALKELSNSLSGQLEPHTIAVADRTVTLTGTVEEQYAQWREILKEIYEAEIGAPTTPIYSDQT
ncbi:MAG: hypothetical protein AAF387_08060 [Pseudomonadota bacterium]